MGTGKLAGMLTFILKNYIGFIVVPLDVVSIQQFSHLFLKFFVNIVLKACKRKSYFKYGMAIFMVQYRKL